MLYIASKTFYQANFKNKAMTGSVCGVVMTTPIHQLPRFRIGKRPSDMKVSCEYGNKQCWTKSRVTLWQGIAPISHSDQGYSEDISSRMSDWSTHGA